MLPGRAKRSHASPWHLGQSRGGVTTFSGSYPQERHCIWNTATRCGRCRAGSYVAKCPSEPKRSMLIDIVTLLLRLTYNLRIVSGGEIEQRACHQVRQPAHDSVFGGGGAVRNENPQRCDSRRVAIA